jgi:hypothetical protein
VILLPEGHLENEYHFQDQPAFSGQKFDNSSPNMTKGRVGYSPLLSQILFTRRQRANNHQNETPYPATIDTDEKSYIPF